jgi:hypothetical protein
VEERPAPPEPASDKRFAKQQPGRAPAKPATRKPPASKRAASKPPKPKPKAKPKPRAKPKQSPPTATPTPIPPRAVQPDAPKPAPRSKPAPRAKPAPRSKPRPAPAPAPAPQARAPAAPRFEPSHQAAAAGPQSCRIRLSRGYMRTYFYAESATGESIAESPNFTNSAQAASAFEALIEQLAGHGWQVASRRPGTWDVALVHRPNAERQPVDNR